MSTRTDLTFLIYDFEVWKHDWLVTFKNHWTKETKTFHNDRDGLLKFLDAHNDAILVGFNNSYYDDWILFAIQNDCDPFKLSKYLIEDKGSPYLYPQLKFKKKQFASYDMMRDVILEHWVSLKQFEGFLGLRIFESDIPWDLDRPLTEEELADATSYNLYDVDATDMLFERFSTRIDAHIALIEHYDSLSPFDLIKTGSQKAAIIFKAEPITRYDTFQWSAPDVLRKHISPHLISFYENKIFSANRDNDVRFIERQLGVATKQTNSLKHQEIVQGITFGFGVGGLHGARDHFRYKGKIWNLDVNSFYPSLMVEYNYISRACPNGAKFLDEMRKQRLHYKEQGHVLDLAMKLIIVAIYGNMAYKYSKMWDLAQQTSICITGQLMLFWLVQLLEPYATIIQANTDGVMIIPHNEEEVRRVWKLWEDETKMTLELSEGVEIIQKDVNNYILLKKDREEILKEEKSKRSKYIKTKGGLVRFWNSQMHKGDFDFRVNTYTNQLTILDECVVNYLLWNIKPMETLLNCDDPLRFMKVVKLQGKYKMAFWGDEYLRGKTFRVFFVKEGKMVYKAYEKDGEIKKEKFANFSPNSVVLNGDIRNKKVADLNLDYEYYESLAWNMIKLFDGE